MSSKNKNVILSSFLLLIFVLISLFTRSFLGIYIYGFRIGEILVAISFLLFISTLLNFMKVDKKIKLMLWLLFVTFLFNVFISNSNLLDPYTFKSSSYIWTLSFFVLGNNLKHFDVRKKEAFLFQLLLLSIFFISVYGLPDVFESFFSNYSDKYELHKGSDLALFYIILNLKIRDYFNYTYRGFVFLILNAALFAPLVLFRSRAAFIGILFFFFYELINYFKNTKVLNLKNLPLFLFALLIGTYSTLVCQNKVISEEINPVAIQNSYSELGKYRFQHFNEEYPFLYIENKRVFSSDGNLNWRLDMWQDQIEDIRTDNKIIFGYGYYEKFKIFTVNNTGYGNDRKGLDQLNEHLHNYLLTVFSRGGLIHLIIFVYLFYLVLKIYNKKEKKHDLLIYLISLLFVSSFDSSMENSHFPLIFYFFLGNSYFRKVN